MYDIWYLCKLMPLYFYAGNINKNHHSIPTTTSSVSALCVLIWMYITISDNFMVCLQCLGQKCKVNWNVHTHLHIITTNKMIGNVYDM